MRMLAEDELRDAVLLIFANKQDLPNAMNAAEITDKLGLHSLRNRNWYVMTWSALSKMVFFKFELQHVIPVGNDRALRTFFCPRY